MTSDAAVEALVLELAVEDYYGLWELLASVPPLTGTNDEKLNKQAVVDAIGNLVRLGLVAVFRGTSFGGEEEQLADEAAIASADASEWSPDWPIGIHLRIGATERGEAKYYSA